jgi:hypothetical protein
MDLAAGSSMTSMSSMLDRGTDKKSCQDPKFVGEGAACRSGDGGLGSYDGNRC